MRRLLRRAACQYFSIGCATLLASIHITGQRGGKSRDDTP